MHRKKKGNEEKSSRLPTPAGREPKEDLLGE